MSVEEVLLILLALALIANAFLLAAVPLRSRTRRTTIPPAQPVAAPIKEADHVPASEDERTARAIEAFVRDVSSTSAVAPAGKRAAAGEEANRAPQPVADRTVRDNVPIDPRRKHAAPAETRDGAGPAAAFLDQEAWDRAVREESARFARFGRPVTVISIELAGLSRVADGLGPEVADRVARETARALVAEARAVDRIAWLDTATFGALLLETDGPAANAYIDRVRATVEGWLDSAGLAVGLSIGSATPEETGDLGAAVAMATQRMHADRGQAQQAAPAGR